MTDMVDRSPGGLDVAVELGQIASEPGDVRARAYGVLELLRRLVPFEAASVHLLDPRRREFLPLASTGYDVPTQDHMKSLAFLDEVESVGLNRSRRTLRFLRHFVPRTELRTWAAYLEPAGLRAGVWVCLCHPDGRHLGLLTMHTGTWDQPTDATCDLLGLLAPAIANAVDQMRPVVTVAQTIAGAMAGIVMIRPGRTEPLPGLPVHHLIEEDSAVLAAVARHLVEGQGRISFLCPCITGAGDDDHLRITALACSPELFHRPTTVVVVSPPGQLYGLTGRELEILGFVVEGWSNNRIAGVLFITERTVAAHVEHILAKLGVANRTLAAVRALRAGLYVPRELTVAQPDDDRLGRPEERCASPSAAGLGVRRGGGRDRVTALVSAPMTG
jgi:DNA-binding CsgD family transcriptional regulator